MIAESCVCATSQIVQNKPVDHREEHAALADAKNRVGQRINEQDDSAGPTETVGSVRQTAQDCYIYQNPKVGAQYLEAENTSSREHEIQPRPDHRNAGRPF